MTGTDLQTTTSGGDLLSPEELAALQALQADEIDDNLLQTPLLKIAQSLTKEVEEELVDPGEFVNSLTGESLGTRIGFIVSAYQKGRFGADRKTGRGYSFIGRDGQIPESWADLLGEEWVGTLFSEHPDAEEVYRHRANVLREIEWGSGPLISTTHNFTGYAVISAPEGSDEPDEYQPVRISLKRTDVPSARKWLSLIRLKRNRPVWDYVYDLRTRKKSFSQGFSFLLDVTAGRETNGQERSLAVELSQSVFAGRVTDNQDSEGDPAPVEPDARGGLDV